MIKVETVGMLEVAKLNSVLTSTSDVANYSFVVDDDETYLVANTLTGDESYCEDVVFKAGEYLNGFLLNAWEGKKLVIDAKHINADYSDLSDGKFLSVNSDGKLDVADSAPASGVYFKVKDVDIVLTESAVKAKICIA